LKKIKNTALGTIFRTLFSSYLYKKPNKLECYIILFRIGLQGTDTSLQGPFGTLFRALYFICNLLRGPKS
jgi:hypothetical protein